ncbi:MULTISPECIES: hypothetical protein [unclassified Streptomyces]|uniref:hypothetical protein n=1 Tax=unclassified Streptomyces TaxID=2593676 RepID=UPI0038636F7F|nr:hypothetical protein OH827_19225 [Streptomyces sp. NBC_00891]WSY07001.1 hypothetical protein OG464_19225 [Streptomyces sp. NBC_00890]WSZ08627.1 hypothetical protein OG704_19225 [Streptomyces sp. NBC_00869]WSZ23874.1 hypothetical protein OG498_14340 [Streptomyces sp. NBC_00870]
MPGVPLAATIIHHGPMDGVLPTAHALARWIDAHGYRPDDPAAWVTGLQQPVVAV